MRPGFLVPGSKFSFIQKHEISGSRNAFGSSRACKGGMWDRPSPALCFFFGRKAIHTFWRGSLHTVVLAARDLSATAYLEPSCPCCGLVPVPTLGEKRAESCPQLDPFTYLSLSLQETKPAPSVFCMGALWDEVIGIPAAG